MIQSLNLLFCGNFAPVYRFEPLILDECNVFDFIKNYVKGADLSFLNLECPLTFHDIAIKKDGPLLKAHPKCAKLLNEAGFNIVGLANNHIMDYGYQGLIDTIDACQKVGLNFVGVGENITQARRPHVTEIKGVRIALIAIAEQEFNQATYKAAGSANVNPIDNYHQIQYAKQHADIIIITLHGGNEYFPYPRPGLRKICQYYIDLGVDAVICHHPHVPGAYEYYQGKPIIYSLGNFLFDRKTPPHLWNLGYMANLSFDVDTKSFLNLQLIPYHQSVEAGGIILLSGNEKHEFLKGIEAMRKKLENHQDWLDEWFNFVHQQSDIYFIKQYSPILFRGMGRFARHTSVSKLFVRAHTIPAKLNLLRCQSHHELLITALEMNSYD